MAIDKPPTTLPGAGAVATPMGATVPAGCVQGAQSAVTLLFDQQTKELMGANLIVSSEQSATGHESGHYEATIRKEGGGFIWYDQAGNVMATGATDLWALVQRARESLETRHIAGFT